MKHMIKSTILALSLGFASVFGLSIPAHAGFFDFTATPTLIPYGYDSKDTINGTTMYCNNEMFMCFIYGEARLTYDMAGNREAREILETIKPSFDGDFYCTLYYSSLNCTKNDGKYSQFMKFEYSEFYRMIKVVRVVYFSNKKTEYDAEYLADQVL